jgi:hypothetical protein
MEPLAQQRHDWVHGVVVSIESVNGRFPIAKLDYRAQEHIIRQIEFDPIVYDIFVQELLSLGKDLTLFGNTLVERFQ